MYVSLSPLFNSLTHTKSLCQKLGLFCQTLQRRELLNKISLLNQPKLPVGNVIVCACRREEKPQLVHMLDSEAICVSLNKTGYTSTSPSTLYGHISLSSNASLSLSNTLSL